MKPAAIAKGLVQTFYLAAIFACMGASAEAGLLVGSSVTGELYFGNSSINAFYPPGAGCTPNAMSSTVTVSDAAPEFCHFLLGFVTVDLNSSNPQLAVSFNTFPSGTIPKLTIYLTDTAFEGLSLSKLTDSFLAD